MSADSTRNLQMSEADLLGLATRMLHKAFHDCSRIDAKRRYRALEQGKRVLLTELRNKNGGDTVRVVLSLDRSELRGNLNFTLLRALTGQLVTRFAHALNNKEPLNSFSDDEQRRLFLLPAMGGIAQHTNVLVLAVNTGRVGEMELELMFLDPDQFKQDDQAANA